MNERLLVILLTAVQFTHMVDFVLMMPLGPQLQRELSCTPSAFTVLVASYTLAAGVAAATVGLVIDRFDRKLALLTLYFGLTTATAACGLCHAYGSLLLARIAAGACGGMLSSIVLTIIGERIPYERRGAATGMVMAAFSLASMAGIPFGTYLARHGHWQTPFLVLSAVGAVVFAICRFSIRRMVEHLHGPRRDAWATVRAVLSQREHWRAYSLTIALTFAGFAVIPLLATYLVLNVGIGEDNIGWFYAIGGVATAITGPLIGRLADRYGKHRTFVTVALLSIIPIAIVTHLPHMSLVATILCGTVFMVLVSGRFIPAMAIITQAATPNMRGGFQAYNTALQSLTAGIAALVAGLAVGKAPDGSLTGYGRAGWIAVGATLVAAWLGSRLRPVVVSESVVADADTLDASSNQA
jgi:predicted MFS family arabinose efflux permease